MFGSVKENGDRSLWTPSGKCGNPKETKHPIKRSSGRVRNVAGGPRAPLATFPNIHCTPHPGMSQWQYPSTLGKIICGGLSGEKGGGGEVR